jgi:hypothetical protein
VCLFFSQFAETFKEANGSVKSLDNKPDIGSSQTTAVHNGTASNSVNRSSSINSTGSTGSGNQDVS